MGPLYKNLRPPLGMAISGSGYVFLMLYKDVPSGQGECREELSVRRSSAEAALALERPHRLECGIR